MISLFLLCFIVSLYLSWFLTSRVRRYALAKDMLDIPNSRSSHSVPTPRGGGIAIVVVLILSAGLSLFFPAAQLDLLLCLLFTTLAFALLGWQDDKHDLSASSRFFIQLLIAAVSSVWLLWNTSLWALTLINVLIFLLSILWIVWMTNIYNFMDGIDGISAIETIVLGATAAYWFTMAGSLSAAFICIAVAGAALGF
ncbi:MAG: glycosyl transferase, partial [Gammaproteobacteria bacterium]|nr:glycosyl transferase [Gammaproteobacteria bacterium]